MAAVRASRCSTGPRPAWDAITAAMFSPSGYSGNVVKNRMAITDASQLGFNPRGGQSKPVDMPLPSKDPNTAPAQY